MNFTRPNKILPVLGILAWGLLGSCGRDAALYPERPSWQARGEMPESRFGFRACSAGDIDGSGYDALIVGAPGYDHSRGKVYLYLGGPGGLSKSPAWTAEGEAPGDAFGDRVGCAGDLNGDGFDDVYVSASSWGKGLGKVYVFYGGPAGLPPKASWTARGQGKAPLSFGDCTVPAGDLRHSGYDDLAIGAYGYDGLRGEVFIYDGSAHGLAKAPSWRAEGEARGDQFGYGLGPLGDINNDGFDDLMIGSKYHSGPFSQAGRAYLYLGSKSGLGAPALCLDGDSRSANLGTRIYGAGNLGAGAFPLFLLSAPYAHAGQGELFLFQGAGGGFAAKPALQLPAPSGQAFGYALGPLGRVSDSQGTAFFASSRSPDGSGEVRIFTFEGGRMRLLQSLKSGVTNDRFGQWAAPLGDVNADGAADLVVSADADGPGRVDVFYGVPQKSGWRNPDASLAYFLGGESARRRLKRRTN
jgi:hypothetical protein